MVESAEQARGLVAAVTYPPEGMRGVASIGRASRFGTIPDYAQTARDEICLLLQVETRAGLAALDEILAVDGADGIFIGPADLSAELGHLGNPGHPEVRATIEEAICRVVAAGRAAGIMITDLEQAAHYVRAGATFVATCADTGVFSSALRDASAAAHALKSPGDGADGG